MSECRRCGNETDRHSVADQPLCWDCADHGPVDKHCAGDRKHQEDDDR